MTKFLKETITLVYVVSTRLGFNIISLLFVLLSSLSIIYLLICVAIHVLIIALAFTEEYFRGIVVSQYRHSR